MKQVSLLPDWKDILKKAWSVRLMVLAGFLSGLEVVLPLVVHAIPQGIFGVLSFVVTSTALMARVVAQKP